MQEPVEVSQRDYYVGAIGGAISLAAVLNSRNEKQDRRLRKKLANFRDDLHTLIEQGKDEELDLTTAPAS